MRLGTNKTGKGNSDLVLSAFTDEHFAFAALAFKLDEVGVYRESAHGTQNCLTAMGTAVSNRRRICLFVIAIFKIGIQNHFSFPLLQYNWVLG